jgi:hypothetical protein
VLITLTPGIFRVIVYFLVILLPPSHRGFIIVTDFFLQNSWNTELSQGPILRPIQNGNCCRTGMPMMSFNLNAWLYSMRYRYRYVPGLPDFSWYKFLQNIPNGPKI